ncbi:AAA family ATPase [Kutzneria sp. 744]|uniref:AAA family ATPase n=1 Tax=Kutzneria sp. (strain 744) TaxID=345341 RepID=UPI0012FA95EF|nr:AAA family ATPase [Kutzneria sp. 744]
MQQPKTSRDQPTVVAVCGCPGTGKTMVARAVAHRLGVPLLIRDEIKAGLGLSSASVGTKGIQFTEDFHIAGGPVSARAEAVMIDLATKLAGAGVSFVVESSVLSGQLLDGLRAADARVLAVHVVADEAVIAQRLSSRGTAVDAQLAELFRRGEMPASLFEPPAGVDAVVKIDTSEAGPPAVEEVEAAVLALLAVRR